ncbi:MAG TPA: SWIM zinc finger family protein [Kofleriaceae bacterium]|nr:SWIM zinc finger family protein [Kofleriaceae bacterium]
MKYELRYQGHSGLRELAGAAGLRFATNLGRLPVSFDAELVHPLRFREAVSALHEIVVGDLRLRKRDRSAHEAWRAQQAADEAALRKAVLDRSKAQALAEAPGAISPTLEADFRRLHDVYWKARRAWAAELGRNDPALFRALVPCDPVVTVAPDVVTFECFSKDESSYGCLSVDRDAFQTADDAALGTTNVDYSLALYEQFQTIRSYRPTRLQVDPGGVAAAVGAAPAVREEKIDLPASWLRGFGQLQAAMALPARHVELSTDVVYSLLAYLRRHRERTGPRSLRFVLAPGRAPQVVLEPWGVTLTSHGAPYAGERAEEIKVWGRRRLMAFARTLPIAERFEVRLLGTGLPSVWIARLGELRLTLALSGWTANDWSRGSNLDQHFARYVAHPSTVDRLARELAAVHAAPLAALAAKVNEPAQTVLGSLFELARRGQVAYDFAANAYRWRPILDTPVTDAMLGPEPEETVAGRRLAAAVTVERTEPLDDGRRALVAKVGGTSCEAVLDADDALGRARCTCSYFHRFRLRAGPCRHLLALRLHASRRDDSSLPVARVLPPRGS